MIVSNTVKWLSRGLLSLSLVLLLAIPGLAKQTNFGSLSIEGEPALNYWRVLGFQF